MLDVRRACQELGGIGVAVDKLDEVRIEVASAKALLDDLYEERGAPDNMFRAFKDDGVAGKERSEYGRPGVVQRVVPGDDGAHDTERLVPNLGAFVRKQPRVASVLWAEVALSVAKNPVRLGAGGENFAKSTVN